MTDKKLIQALRCCEKLNGCCVCPAREDDCRGVSYGHVAARLEALLAENEHLREATTMVPKWVSVEERLPETELETASADEPDDAIACDLSACVLVIDRTGEVRVARYESGPYFQGWQENGRAVGEVTHWMPLPSTEGVG